MKGIVWLLQLITDVLVLSCYHWKKNLYEVLFSTKVSKKKKAAGLNFWSIQFIAESLPLASLILFAHAWSGYETTMILLMKGNTLYLNKLSSNNCNTVYHNYIRQVMRVTYCLFLYIKFLRYFSISTVQHCVFLDLEVNR